MESSSPFPPPWDDFLRGSYDNNGSPFGVFDGGLRLSQTYDQPFTPPPDSFDPQTQQYQNQPPQQFYNQYPNMAGGVEGGGQWMGPEGLPTPPRGNTPIVKSEFENHHIVRVKSETTDRGLRASPDCFGRENGRENRENTPPNSPVVKEEKGLGSSRGGTGMGMGGGFLSVKSEYVATVCGGLQTIDSDIIVELYKGPWSDFFGATDRCQWQQSCLQGIFFHFYFSFSFFISFFFLFSFSPFLSKVKKSAGLTNEPSKQEFCFDENQPANIFAPLVSLK